MKIEAGQIWSYKSRKSERRSKITVIQLDNLEHNIIVHIKIDSLKLVEQSTGKVIATSIEHLPISLEMFKKSVRKIGMVGKVPTNEGCLEWEKLFDIGKAGIWSIEIAKAIEITEATYNSADR